MLGTLYSIGSCSFGPPWIFLKVYWMFVKECNMLVCKHKNHSPEKNVGSVLFHGSILSMCSFFASHIPDRGSRVQTRFDQISPLASSTRDLGTRLGFWLNIKLILYICCASMCYPWFKFYFLLFELIILYYYTQKQRKLKFKPRIKLNHNIFKWKWGIL